MPIANQEKITAAFVQQFARDYEIACQRKESVLVGTVMDKGSITGSSFTINDMGKVEMGVHNKFADTPWTLPDSGTRIAYMKDSDLYIPVDKFDLQKLIADPRGKYMDLSIYAANRKKDNIVYRSLLDVIPRKTEENGALTNVAIPAGQIIADGGTGFTADKLRFAKSLFRKNECDEQNGEELFMIYDSNMLNQLLANTTLTSSDYMAIQMLFDGAIGKKWMGFTWVAYESLDETAGVRTTVAYCKSAVEFGTGINTVTDIGIRRDKSNAIQISTEGSWGAGRANELKVVPIKFKI